MKNVEELPLLTEKQHRMLLAIIDDQVRRLRSQLTTDELAEWLMIRFKLSGEVDFKNYERYLRSGKTGA